MKRVLFIIIAVLTLFQAGAQVNRLGVPIIRNYGQEYINGTDYVWSILKDKSGVVYMGTNGKGIVRYDGHTWSVIPVPGDPVIRVLRLADDGVIYVGGSVEFGFLQPSAIGKMEYISLSDNLIKPTDDSTAGKNAKYFNKSQIGEIRSIIVLDSTVFFQGKEFIFIYKTGTGEIDAISLRDAGLRQVVKMVHVNDRIVIADNIRGLFSLKEKTFLPLPGGDKFGMKICMMILPFGEDNLIVGTYTDGVFKLNYSSGGVSGISSIPHSLNETLKNSQILSGLVLPTGEILIGTQQDGIFVFDPNFNLTGKWDTKTTSLPDNTVPAFYIDSDRPAELWISTAGHVSKAYIQLPYEISTRMGFEGLINNIAEFNGAVYLATDNGLFRSTVDENGNLMFENAGNISYQTFTLYKGKTKNETFLLAGSGLGLFCVKSNGQIYKVDDALNYQYVSKKGSYYVRSVLQSNINPELFFIGLDANGLIVLKFNGNSWSYVKQIKAKLDGYISSLIENENGDLFIYTGNPIGLFYLKQNDSIPSEFTTADGLPNSAINGISKIGNNIVLVTARGLYRYDVKAGKWIPYDDLLSGFTRNVNCRDLYQDNDGDIWLSSLDDRFYEMFFRRDTSSVNMIKGPLNIMPGVEKYDLKHFAERIWIPKAKSIYVIDKERIMMGEPSPNAMLTKIVIGSDSLLMNGTFVKTLKNGMRVPALNNKENPVAQIKFNFNSVSFFWSVPYFIDEEAITYSYKLDGFDKSWSKWDKVNYKDFTNLPFGRYTFRVKGKTLTDIETREVAYDFLILKPWYLTNMMIILYAIAFILLILGIIKAYTRKLKNENIRLEGIVAERTAVVVKQKEELESSIHYARRIQMALLPSEAILSENLKNYFILFKPRDIVSGDFYWMTKKENRLYIVAADCTGHGVPGAFMSLLGMSFLDEIIDKEKSPRADHILSELRLHVTESLKQSGGDDEAKDGMDMALLVIDFNTSRIEFSGAYNPCLRVRELNEQERKAFHEENIEMPDGSMTNGTYLLETIFASKMPIGISSRMDEDFVFYDWELEKGVSYYLFSDGYIDQFGGHNGRKFMKKNFKRLILEIQEFPMKRQKEILEEKLIEWMGQTPQIDDILVMGIRTE